MGDTIDKTYIDLIYRCWLVHGDTTVRIIVLYDIYRAGGLRWVAAAEVALVCGHSSLADPNKPAQTC